MKGASGRVLSRILDRPRTVIALISAVTIFFALQLPGAKLDNDVMSFVPATHPEKIAMDEIHDTYDATIPMSVGIEFSYGTIFSAPAIVLVRTLTEELESMEGIRSVTSLTNADYLEGLDGGMRVTPLVAENFSGTAGEIEELKRRVLSWELYDNSLYSRDFRATQILVGLPYRIGADEREAAYYRIRDILRKHEQPGVDFYFAGDPVIAVLLSASMRSDLLVLIPLVVLVVLTALFLFFRRAGGVLLPIITVLISSVWTIGAMSLLGIALTMVATVIPVLMVAVGSAYGIHIVNDYYRSLDAEQRPIEADRHREIIEETLRTVGRPVLMAGLTTIIGFGALTVSQVGPMRSFGVFTAFGVATALLVALTLIPALLRVRGPGAARDQTGPSGADRDTTGMFLLGLYEILSRGRWRVLFLALAVGALAVWGTSRVVVDNELIMYFKGDTEIRRADEFLRSAFGGTRTFNIEVIGEEPGALTNPEILQAMDELARYLVARWPAEVPKVLGYQNFIMRMNQVMHVDEPPPGDRVSRAAPARPTHPPRRGELIPFWHLGRDLTDGAFDQDGSGDEAFADEFADEFSDGFGEDGFGWDFETFEERDGMEAAAETGEAEVRAPPVPPALPAPPAAMDTETLHREFAVLLNRAYRRTGNRDISATDMLDLINREVNYEGAAYYEIPWDPSRYRAETREELANLIAQYLLIYSGGLEEFADEDLEPSRARMLVQLGTTGNIFTEEVTREIESFAAHRFPAGYRVRTAGIAIVEQAISRMISNAQFYSIAVSLTLVFLVVSITFRSLQAGIFGLVPLGFTILVNFGLMGLAGINLDVSTAMVASIAIGIGIDYTIHFLSAYHREYLRDDDPARVEQRVLDTTGRAILFNALSVAAGFAVLVFSRFNPLMHMGALIAITMFTSSIAAMTILPVLLGVFKPRFLRREV